MLIGYEIIIETMTPIYNAIDVQPRDRRNAPQSMQCLSSPKVQFVGLLLVILCDFKANSEFFFGSAGASMQMAATLFDLRELMSRTKTASEIQCLVFLMIMEMG